MKRESRPEHKRRDHTRDEHLAWSGERHDAGRDVDGDAVDITVAFLDLAGVQSDTDLQSQLLHCHAERTGTFDRPRRTVERRERTVAGELHDLATPARHMLLDQVIVGGKGFRPRFVAQRSRTFGRSDDVGE